MNVKNYISFFVLLLLSGCSTINPELVTKEKLLTNSGQTEQLIEFYKVNLVEVPSYKIKLINLYLDNRDQKSAELYINTLKKKDLEDPEVIYILAKLEYLKRNYDASDHYLDDYLENGGPEGNYYLLKGKILARKKDYSGAIANFNDSKKNGASDREANNNIAVVMMLQGRPEPAMELLYSLFAANPNDEKVRSNLLLASTRSHRPDVALEVLKHDSSEQEARVKLKKLMQSVKPLPEKVMKKAPTKQVAKVKEKKNMEMETKSVDLKPKYVARSVLDPKNLRPKAPSIYRIQVLATYKVIPSDYLNYLKGNYGSVYSYTHGLWKRYCIGEFSDINDAKKFLENMDIKGAFVVDYTKKRYVEL
ncbi:pilus assembly protein TadD [Vibrio harveyi]|uniref:tetratricopeptide repeat protein n=1 Tax=Vibrio harveyi TaxID=669 RepID=UPI0038CD869D